MGEEEWDAVADQYYAKTQQMQLPIAGDVRDWLETIGTLPTGNVLDIAGGCGRFAVEFAKSAQSVDIIDWSSAMLHNAARHAEDRGLSNIGFIHGDWTKIPLKPADLVFVSELDSLRTADLPFLYSISRRALVVGDCTANTSTLLTRAARALNIRYVPQGVHAELPAAYQQHFATAGIISSGHVFSYHIDGTTSVHSIAATLEAAPQDVARALGVDSNRVDAPLPDEHDVAFTFIAVLNIEEN